MGRGRNRFLNLCARVWYFSGTELSSWNSPEARSKMKIVSPRVRNIILYIAHASKNIYVLDE